ncbi:MAG: SIR2 family protein [Candidatus Brocadia sp.]|nr:MAG: SIR2 family protein [Candidatus Brocadia sp.]
MSYSTLSYDAFLRITSQNKNLEYVFLLGAGASISSGVPSAEDCIWEWKKEIFLTNNLHDSDLCDDLKLQSTRIKIQKWIDADGSCPPLDDPQEYSFFAERAYPTDESRRKYFENLFQGKSPSFGYHILCLLAKEGMAKIVFTTNFDGLLTRAAYLNNLTPIEVTIDTEDYIHRQLEKNRIMCVALHGDYKYEKLKNTGKELDNQSVEFEKALQFHLYNKNLIVLGYSGRDKLLMSALEKAYSTKGSGALFWCSYKDKISQDVEILLNRAVENDRKAYLVLTNGFDETLHDIAKYCFSDNNELQKKLSEIVQIKDINSPNEELHIEPLSTVSSILVDGSHINIEKEIVSIESSTTQPFGFHESAFLSELTISCIIGAWNESVESDKDVITNLSKRRYIDWIVDLRQVLHLRESPLKMSNGIWYVIDRKALWNALGSRIFDDHLDQFKRCVTTVLTELDPQFELPVDKRYAVRIYGKVLKHSSDLRKGLAETLALLGNYGNVLKNCAQDKPESTAILAIREIFEGADWRLWGSLNDLLPTLAEAAPGEFLDLVEKALQQSPCPFDELFVQEGSSVTGRNHMIGLLRALECLAWHEEHLVHVAMILAELAFHDPGGNLANRPANSLTTILLPWLPQTLAPIHKRITSIKAIKTEFPDVAWNVLLSLLPNQHHVSTGTYKPRWSNILPDDWKPKVTNKVYWEQVTGYAEIAVEIACKDLDKLNELIGNLDNLPKPSFDTVLEYLSSAAITQLPEIERLPIWSSLTKFTRKHRRFSSAKWTLDDESVSRIEATANRLTPNSPEILYRNLFSSRDFDLYEENDNWKEQRKKLDERRQKAIQEIINASGIQGVMEFVDAIESPSMVGWTMGTITPNTIDPVLLPEYLDVKNIKYQQFAGGFVWSRYQQQGWQWVDCLDRTNWSLMQICQFLMHLPFEVNTWCRANNWLGDSESMYWQKVTVNPHQSDSDLLLAIDKLLSVARPQAAIDCLYYRFYKKLPLDRKRTVKALMDAVSVKELVNMETYHITELIKALQNDSETEEDDLSRIEWAYLPLLDRHSEAEPKLLEKRLATQPGFFCEVIRLVYRSKNEPKTDGEPDKQKETIAVNAWRLLREWKRSPGLQGDGTFSTQDFETWLKSVKKYCAESGHLEVAMLTVGKVLLYCPADPQGLWIVQAVARALNARDAEEIRRGFVNEVFNSRGVHDVDPTGKPEKELAIHWREKADAVENAGFARFAATLRKRAESYDREAEQIIKEHRQG